MTCETVGTHPQGVRGAFGKRALPKLNEECV